MDRFGKNRSETERSRWQPVFRHSNATEIVQEHQPTVWIGFCHLLVTNTVEYPTDRFSKTDLWPICADRNRSMISAIVFRTRSRLPDFEWFNGNSILNVKLGKQWMDRFWKRIHLVWERIHLFSKRNQKVGKCIRSSNRFAHGPTKLFDSVRRVADYFSWSQIGWRASGWVLENRSIEIWAALNSEAGLDGSAIISKAYDVFGIQSTVHRRVHNGIDRF